MIQPLVDQFPLVDQSHDIIDRNVKNFVNITMIEELMKTNIKQHVVDVVEPIH